MNYNFNGKTLKIPDKEIEVSMKNLELTRDEAIQMWLEDNGYMDNEEQNTLDEHAKAERITATIHQASAVDKSQKKKRNVQKKEDPNKALLIQTLAHHLKTIASNVIIENSTKIITFEYEGEKFKLDLSRTRVKKKEEA